MVNYELKKDASAKGYFWRVKFDEAVARAEVIFSLGLDAEKILCYYRINACFIESVTVDNFSLVPGQTIFAIVKKRGGGYAAVYALTDSAFVTYFEGAADGLHIVLDTKNDNITAKESTFCFVGEGNDVFALTEASAREISKRFKSCKLVGEKVCPSFTDYFGFCTYNAFYDKISSQKIYNLLTEWKEKGLNVGALILDNGWQQDEKAMLKDFREDTEKFPGGMKAFTERLKSIGVSEFIFWQTFYGYWTGVSKSFDYDLVNDTFDVPNSEKKEKKPSPVNTVTEDFYPLNIAGTECNYPYERIEDFYRDYLSYQKSVGATGVKIDAIGWLELFGKKEGVNKIYERYISALSRVIGSFFNYNAIACSSETVNFLLASENIPLIRSSKDYIPEEVKSYAPHVVNNLKNVLYYGPFFICDFDMFQSGYHGLFHAVARAISGGPVYCADNSETADVELLKALCSSDGKVPLCDTNARISEGDLFKDAYNAGTIKAWNTFGKNLLIAAFNCDAKKKNVAEFTVSEFSEMKEYALYSYKKGYMGIFTADKKITVELDCLDADLFTAVPVVNGSCVIGLKGKFVPVGYFTEKNGGFFATDSGIFKYVKDGKLYTVERKKGEKLF